MKYIVHSTNCPKCKILIKKLTDKNINYEVNTDIELMKSKGLTTAPALELVGDEARILLFADAIRYINTL